ncbi:MAG: GntR family transcriptional regulator [Hyphomicrobiaceae bacterium]|nr:GntR family transcriptional regulator [Hyphomicrobiaceae bacterium]
MTQTSTRVIASGSTVDEIFEAISERIATGEISGGEKLNEQQLADHFGTSRGPIREAISRLAGSGLVERKPNVGVTVRAISRREVIQFYEFRAAIEGVAASMAARLITPGGIARLQQAIDTHERALNERAPTYHMEDIKFHQIVCELSGNRFFSGFLSADFYRLLMICRQQFKYTAIRGADALEDHRRIFSAIAEGDAELAEFLSHRHVVKALEGARNALEVDGDDMPMVGPRASNGEIGER